MFAGIDIASERHVLARLDATGAPVGRPIGIPEDRAGYDTLLDVRRGPSCPGTEVPLGCTIGVGARKSFLDLTLDAGVYFIQIDGYFLAQGPWVLDVRVVDP